MRDWVVRGEEAKDLDVECTDPGVTAAALGTLLPRLQVTKCHSSASLTRVSVTCQSGASVTVDLVRAGAFGNLHFDMNVNNLCVSAARGLQLKLARPCDSVAATIRHILHKTMVIGYPEPLDQRAA